MVDITEFPQLAIKHDVQSVPVIIINDRIKVNGRLSETELAGEILKAIGQ